MHMYVKVNVLFGSLLARNLLSMFRRHNQFILTIINNLSEKFDINIYDYFPVENDTIIITPQKCIELINNIVERLYTYEDPEYVLSEKLFNFLNETYEKSEYLSADLRQKFILNLFTILVKKDINYLNYNLIETIDATVPKTASHCLLCSKSKFYGIFCDMHYIYSDINKPLNLFLNLGKQIKISETQNIQITSKLHKHKNMLMCIVSDCKQIAMYNYNYLNLMPLFCDDHKVDLMVMLNSTLCYKYDCFRVNCNSHRIVGGKKSAFRHPSKLKPKRYNINYVDSDPIFRILDEELRCENIELTKSFELAQISYVHDEVIIINDDE